MVLAAGRKLAATTVSLGVVWLEHGSSEFGGHTHLPLMATPQKGRAHASGGLQWSLAEARGLRRKLHPACALFFVSIR
jgi:hypothetical protein